MHKMSFSDHIFNFPFKKSDMESIDFLLPEEENDLFNENPPNFYYWVEIFLMVLGLLGVLANIGGQIINRDLKSVKLWLIPLLITIQFFHFFVTKNYKAYFIPKSTALGQIGTQFITTIFLLVFLRFKLDPAYNK